MVVTLHRGEVFAESLEGVGSRFVVHLPSANVANCAPEWHGVDKKKVD
jgi:signal transduction histidine kinase